MLPALSTAKIFCGSPPPGVLAGGLIPSNMRTASQANAISLSLALLTFTQRHVLLPCLRSSPRRAFTGYHAALLRQVGQGQPSA